MNTHIVEIWIWGVKFTTEASSLDQCDHAQQIVKSEYPGMTVMVKQVEPK